MRPQNPLDWVAFVFLLIGAFAWGYFFLTGINVIETLFNPITYLLSAIVYVLILLSAIYWVLRVTVLRSWGGRFPRRRRRR
jgi:uncharacterized membrane protein YuzA (DUF378 family)